jgi:hypothetical protein
MPSKQMLGKTAPALVMFFLTAATSQNLMLYAGQEFGERADEAEGFSGADGKTTIFDYWSVGSLRRYYNQGRWDGATLLPQEKLLREQYKDILGLHAKLAAEKLTQGYNLQPANAQGYGSAGLEDGLALLLTGSGTQPVLVVASFVGRIERFAIKVPAEAHSFAQGAAVGEELLHLSDARTEAEVQNVGAAGMVVSVTMGAYGCLALRLKG